MCVSRNQRQYAERIEARLRVIGLKVDVLFPNPKVDLNKIMGNIATRGVMFAILITPLNEDHGSVTLNVLQVNKNESILYCFSFVTRICKDSEKFIANFYWHYNLKALSYPF